MKRIRQILESWGYGSNFPQTTTKGENGTLTLSNLEKAYIEAKKFDGCEQCGRPIRYIYFYEKRPFYQCCGYHKLKEGSK